MDRDGHPPTQPAPAPLFSEETVGQLLRQLAIVEAGQRTCEEQNDLIRSELTATRVTVDRISSDLQDVQGLYQQAVERISQLAAAQAEDDRARDRARTVWAMVRMTLAALVVVVLPLVGWGLSAWFDDYSARGETIDAAAETTRENGRRLGRQEAATETMRRAVHSNTRSIDRIETRLEGIATGQQTVQEHTDEILRMLRGRRRVPR